ncbi:MAG TPA: hypothetical protein PKC62_08105 [Ferruginibacter sp.]|nr:hypothetical protein [Bacteroidota bacterium]MBS1926125.1 hypothetical protein [Bacteroidota bacterium]MCC6693242.1 hypothetical protein [Chitinophagaceae bacterium]HMT96635.1 hypothetical protein [Ferruginibacter sp.]HMU24767.1 hypothetical protein [Ferruginibacter sp.]
MKYLLAIIGISLLALGCNKGDFNTVPVITFKSIEPNAFQTDNVTPLGHPMLTITLKDAEGDFGFNDGFDTSYVYVKNMFFTPALEDSFKFPTLSGIDRKNLSVDVSVDLKALALGSGLPGPNVDTIYFEVYVKDFAKNKSNVVQAGPLYLVTP